MYKSKIKLLVKPKQKVSTGLSTFNERNGNAEREIRVGTYQVHRAYVVFKSGFSLFET